MCTTDDEIGITSYADLKSKSLGATPNLDDFAEFICTVPGRRVPGVPFYGEVSAGDKVLIAATNHHDTNVISAITRALKKKGASTVDVLRIDEGEDREINYNDEIEGIIRRESWTAKPRRYDYHENIINYAKTNGYSFLIHGRGGPIPKTDFKFEAMPFQTEDIFSNWANVFPPNLHYLINEKAWKMIYKAGRGGRVRVTDAEGTDFDFTLHEKYFDRNLGGRSGFGPNPVWCHLFSHPTPPIITEEDAVGVVRGTTSHFTRPFPPISVDMEEGKIKEIKGGGKYGEAWNELLRETESIQYPEFPKEGLFYLWELAIGTNPKIRRQKDVLMVRSGGNEWERRRSGVIHVGFGTRWRGPSEIWAAEKKLPFGHLHVHLLFPTYEIRATNGETIKVIENGRLTALDDQEVREAAKKYGNPEELLSEDWIPKIPGVNMDGSYEEYTRAPEKWV